MDGNSYFKQAERKTSGEVQKGYEECVWRWECELLFVKERARVCIRSQKSLSEWECQRQIERELACLKCVLERVGEREREKTNRSMFLVVWVCVCERELGWELLMQRQSCPQVCLELNMWNRNYVERDLTDVHLHTKSSLNLPLCRTVFRVRFFPEKDLFRLVVDSNLGIFGHEISIKCFLSLFYHNSWNDNHCIIT